MTVLPLPTPRPLDSNAGCSPRIHPLLELWFPHCEKLGTMVKDSATKTTGCHPATNAAPLVNDQCFDLLLLEYGRRQQAGNAGADD